MEFWQIILGLGITGVSVTLSVLLANKTVDMFWKDSWGKTDDEPVYVSDEHKRNGWKN